VLNPLEVRINSYSKIKYSRLGLFSYQSFCLDHNLSKHLGGGVRFHLRNEVEDGI